MQSASRHGLLAQARKALQRQGHGAAASRLSGVLWRESWGVNRRPGIMGRGGEAGMRGGFGASSSGLSSHRKPLSTAASAGVEGTQNSAWERYCRVLEKGGWQAILAKAATSAVIGFAGDFLCQMFVERPMLPAENPDELEILTPLELIEVALADETEGPEFDWGEIDINTAWGVEIATEASSKFRVWLYNGMFVRQNETAAPDLTRSCRFAALAAFCAPIGHVWYTYLGTHLPGVGAVRVFQKVLADQLLYSPPFFTLVFSFLAISDGKTFAELKESVVRDVPTTIVASWKLWGPVQLVNFKLVPVHLQVLFVNCVGLFWNTYMSWIIHRKPPAEGVPSSYAEAAEEAPPPTPPVELLQRTMSSGASTLRRIGSGSVLPNIGISSAAVLPTVVRRDTGSTQNQQGDDESEEEGE